MPFGSRHARASRSHSQRGQAMLLVVMLFGMATALLVYGMVDTTSLAAQRDKVTAAALAQAKQALIGRAVADNTRPGSLPCPDTDNDGTAETFVGSDCPSYIGRLPWRTLGLPDPRDASGERLWYVLSTRFRDNSAAEPINSDTKGNLTVYQDSATVTITAEAVAVIFAPGPVVAGQFRDPANANNAVNYLDTTGGVNNAIAGGPFISAQGSATFNDRLLVITTADLMTVVEQRVAREILSLLRDYRSKSEPALLPGGCACYPWADWDIPWTGEGDNDALRGALSLAPGDPHPWGAGGIPPLPAWLLNNEWWRVIYYAVHPGKTETPTAGVLTVDTNPYDVVLIMTGPAGTGPLGNLRPSFNWAHYVDDAENTDPDNIFCRPGPSAVVPCTPTTAYARDRLYTIP